MELPKHLYLSLDQLSLDQPVSTTPLISGPDNPHLANGEETETRDWASLPADLLVSFASRLTSLADFFAFRWVCTSWRSNVIPSAHTLSSQSPLIMMHAINKLWCYDNDEIPEEERDQPSFEVVFLDVMHRRFYKSGSSSSCRSFNLLNFSHGYLAVAYHDGHILLRHFFTNDKIWLPKTRTPFCDRKNIIFSGNPSSPRCMFVCYSYVDNTLEFFQQGESTWKEWTLDNYVMVMDMVFFERKAYALLRKKNCYGDNYQLVVFEFTPTFRFKLLGVPTKFDPCPFLFSYGDELLLSYCPTVFSWDFRGNRWIPKSSLDGRAMFFSTNQLTACIIPNPGSWVKPNCSYFYDMFNFRLSESRAIDDGFNDDGSGYSANYEEYYDGGMDSDTWFIGRPVWIFPSVCFSN